MQCMSDPLQCHYPLDDAIGFLRNNIKQEIFMYGECMKNI